MQKVIFSQVMTEVGKSVFSGLFDENGNAVKVELECGDGGVVLTILRDEEEEKELFDCGISEEEIERVCALNDGNCDECVLCEHCGRD